MDDLMERHVRVKMDGLTLWAYQRSFTVLKRFYYANKSKVRGKLDSMREKMKAKKARSFTSSPLRLPLPTHAHAQSKAQASWHRIPPILEERTRWARILPYAFADRSRAQHVHRNAGSRRMEWTWSCT